nr:MFS transporter [Agrococcus sp. ARC_14]
MHTAWAGARLMVGLAASAMTTDAALLAVIGAGFALPAVIFALPSGALMDRHGPRLLVLVGIAIALAGLVVIATAPSVGALIASNALLGLGQLLCMIGQQGFVADRATDQGLDGAVGTLTSAMAIGQVLGPVLATSAGTVLFSLGAPTVELGGLLLAGLCLLVGIPLAMQMRARASRSQSDHDAAGQPRARVLAPGMWRALLVSGIVLASVDLLYVFLPAWAQGAGVSAIVVGWMLSLRAAVTVVCRFGLDRLVRRFSRAGVLAASLGFGIVGFVLLVFGSQPAAVAAMVLLGVGLGIPQPLTLSWVMRLADPTVRGRALGMRVTSNRVVQVVLPIGVGLVATPAGPAGVFIGSAIALCAAATVSIASRRHLDAPGGP